MKFLQWLKMVLRRFRAQGVHYIGGSDVLPPPLSPEEEAAAVEANSGGDVAARNRLIEHNLRLVVFLARKFESSGVGTEDLISIGTIGLIKAVSTYRSDKNVNLPPRERQIISLRFGIGTPKALTQKEVADLLGISQSYISRLEKRIIARMRKDILKYSAF